MSKALMGRGKCVVSKYSALLSNMGSFFSRLPSSSGVVLLATEGSSFLPTLGDFLGSGGVRCSRLLASVPVNSEVLIGSEGPDKLGVTFTIGGDQSGTLGVGCGVGSSLWVAALASGRVSVRSGLSGGYTVGAMGGSVSAVVGLESDLSDSLAGALGLVRGTGKEVVVAKVNGSKRVKGGVTTSLTSAKAPSFFIRPTSTDRNSLNVVASSSIVVTVSGDNSSESLISVLGCYGHFKVGLVTVAGGPSDSLNGTNSVMLGLPGGKSTYPLKLTPAGSAATALILNSVLATKLVREGNFAGTSFGRERPNKGLNSVLRQMSSLVRASSSVPVLSSRSGVRRILLSVASGELKYINFIGLSNGFAKVLASKSLEEYLAPSVLGRGTVGVVAGDPGAVSGSAVISSTMGVVRSGGVAGVFMLSKEGPVKMVRVRSYLGDKMMW